MKIWLTLSILADWLLRGQRRRRRLRVVQSPRQDAGLGGRGLRGRRGRPADRCPARRARPVDGLLSRQRLVGVGEDSRLGEREGLLGRRVYVADDPGGSLWLAGDMADAVWLRRASPIRRRRGKFMRVLHPGGVCMGGGRVVRKPPQSGVNEWRHPYHLPDNNAASQDRVARLPGRTAFPNLSALRGDAQSDAPGRRAAFLLYRAYRLPRARRTAAEHADGAQRLQRPEALEPPA